MPQKSFEERLRNKAEEFSPVPRPGLWEGIDAQLPPEKKNRRPVLMVVLLTAMILVSSGLLYILESYQTNGISGTVEEEQVLAEKESAAPVTSPETRIPGSLHKDDASDHNVHTNVAEDKQSKQAGGKPGKKTALPVRHFRDLQYRSQAGHTKGQEQGKHLAGHSLSRETAASGLADVIKEEESADITEMPVKALNDIREQVVNKGGVLAEAPPPVKDHMSGAADSTSVMQADTPPARMVKIQDKITAKSSRRFYVELIGMRTLSGSMVGIDKAYRDSASYTPQVEERRNGDKTSWSTDFGIQAGISRPRYDLFAGVSYRELSYRVYVINTNSSIMRGTGTVFQNFDFEATDSFSLFTGKNSIINSTSGSPPPEVIGQYVTNRFRYISIPVGINYHVKKKGSFTFGCVGTFEPQFLLRYDGLLYQNESGLYVKEKSAAENHIRKTNLSFSAGLDVNYRFSGHSGVFLRPSGGLSLFPAEKAAIRTSHKFLSLAAGYRFSF